MKIRMLQGTPGAEPPPNLVGPLGQAHGYWGWEVRRLPDTRRVIRGKVIIQTNTEFTGKRKWIPGHLHPSQLRERKWP